VCDLRVSSHSVLSLFVFLFLWILDSLHYLTLSRCSSLFESDLILSSVLFEQRTEQTDFVLRKVSFQGNKKFCQLQRNVGKTITKESLTPVMSESLISMWESNNPSRFDSNLKKVLLFSWLLQNIHEVSWIPLWIPSSTLFSKSERVFHSSSWIIVIVISLLQRSLL
jgi:hypothetical protein